jgi:hypothetical protein
MAGAAAPVTLTPVPAAPAMPVVPAAPARRHDLLEVIHNARSRRAAPESVPTPLPGVVPPSAQYVPATAPAAVSPVELLGEYAPPLTSPYQPGAPAATPVVPSPVSPAPDVPRLLRQLRESTNPLEREQAVRFLAVMDPPASPEVVRALLASGAEDRAPAVRVACLRALLALRVGARALTPLLDRARSDPDPHVRWTGREVERGLRGGTAALPSVGQSVVRQVP